jgi:hypothetical protein
MQVVDITIRTKYRLVATFADDFIRPEQLNEEMVKLGRKYNNAFLIVENNTYGYAMCRDLWEIYQYENLFRERSKRDHGISANVRSKTISTSVMKKLIEENMITVPDKDTWRELNGFVEIKTGKYACEEGDNNYDDRVMALNWACYFTDTDYWTNQEEYLLTERGFKNINTYSSMITQSDKPEFRPVDMEGVYQKMVRNEEDNW